jgi:hypothetical protein
VSRLNHHIGHHAFFLPLGEIRRDKLLDLRLALQIILGDRPELGPGLDRLLGFVVPRASPLDAIEPLLKEVGTRFEIGLLPQAQPVPCGAVGFGVVAARRLGCSACFDHL